MKKFITLVCCFGLFGSAFAQTGRDRAGDVILGGGTSGQSNPSQYPAGTQQQQDEINSINREYDAKVASVQANNTLSAAEKERVIRQLNAERARRIREVNNRYGQKDGRQNKDYEERRRREEGRRRDHESKRREKHDDDDDKDEDRQKVKKNGKDNGNHYGWEKGKGNPHRDANWQKNKGKKSKS
jgi:hypothetical protein